MKQNQERECVCLVTVMSDFFGPMDCWFPGSSLHGDSQSKNAGVGCHVLLQGIFPTQGLNPGLPHCRWVLYHLSLDIKHRPYILLVYVDHCLYQHQAANVSLSFLVAIAKRELWATPCFLVPKDKKNNLVWKHTYS